MTMKKLTTILLVLVMAFSLAACGNTVDTPTNTPEEDNAQASADTPAETPSATETPADTVPERPRTGKTLVVYFSASGNTARVATDIADAVGADLFEIVPAEPYTSDDLNYNSSSSRVSREHDNETLRNVELSTAEVENWDTYDTVFLGYPIWWGIAAWPVSSFVTANDFAGKTVIPFATSASSGIGDSGTLLAQAADSGDWQDGQRFSSNAAAEEVQSWVNELGLS